MTILVGWVCENGQKVKPTWMKKTDMQHTQIPKGEQNQMWWGWSSDYEKQLKTHCKKQRQKEQDTHVYTHEKTEDRGKGELERQTFSLVQQIFIEAKTDPERWGKQTGEAL